VKPNGIITLTSDFGLEDPFVGIIKGVILSINPTARIVDITHSIGAQDILQGALILRSAYRFFPPGTIHLAVVDPGVGSERHPIVVETPRYIFVGPDNGLLSLAVEEEFSAYLIENPNFFLEKVSQTFHARDIFAPVAAYLSLGIEPSAVGRKLEEIKRLSLPSPSCEERRIIGEIISFDHFGNAITNISEEFLRGKKALKIKVGEKIIEGLSSSYAEKPPLTPLAILGSGGFLEISINLGSARSELKLKKGDEVEVTFD
jgi:S-adenosylmethionine hydrolase